MFRDSQCSNPGMLLLTCMLLSFHLLKDMALKERKLLKTTLCAMADKADKQHYPLEGSERLGKSEVRLKMLLPKYGP